MSKKRVSIQVPAKNAEVVGSKNKKAKKQEGKY